MKNDPAFPEVITQREEGKIYDVYSRGGMTKRELIATEVMSGMTLYVFPGGFDKSDHAAVAAKSAVIYADALIKELEKE